MRKCYMSVMLVVVSSILIFGCAWIVKGGGPENIKLESVPSGANCSVIDNVTGEKVAKILTPAIIPLSISRGYFQPAKYNIECVKDNYLPYNAIVESYISGWYVAGNIFLGGAIGYLIVDPLTGSMWKLKPDVINIIYDVNSSLILNKATNHDNPIKSNDK